MSSKFCSNSNHNIKVAYKGKRMTPVYLNKDGSHSPLDKFRSLDENSLARAPTPSVFTKGNFYI